jgi:hypothetical protein
VIGDEDVDKTLEQQPMVAPSAVQPIKATTGLSSKRS